MLLFRLLLTLLLPLYSPSALPFFLTPRPLAAPKRPNPESLLRRRIVWNSVVPADNRDVEQVDTDAETVTAQEVALRRIVVIVGLREVQLLSALDGAALILGRAALLSAPPCR